MYFDYANECDVNAIEDYDYDADDADAAHEFDEEEELNLTHPVHVGTLARVQAISDTACVQQMVPLSTR
ncbi:hypothetical protein N9L68_08555 [bacterium]|nr:hypothetical protein [bacterium]